MNLSSESEAAGPEPGGKTPKGQCEIFVFAHRQFKNENLDI